MGNVKELREGRGIKQEEMAKVTEMSTANYSKKENGVIKWALSEAKTIADFFDKSIEEIFFDNEVSKTETKPKREG